MKISEIPKIQRPREKLITKGAANLKDEELLVILLGAGIEGKNVMEVARQILQKYPKNKLLKLDFKQLASIKGIGPAKPCALLASQEFISRGLRLKKDTFPKKPKKFSPVKSSIWAKLV